MADDDAGLPLLGQDHPNDDPECASGAWGIRRPARPVEDVAEPENQMDARSLVWSVATLLLSFPALVGSWCWPLLLAGFLGIAATGAAKALAHSVSFAVMLAVTTNLLQYSCWKAQGKSGNWRRKWGPSVLLAAAVPLVTADPTRHVLQDSGVWSGPSSSMYRPGCGPVSGLHGFLCLSATGAVFQTATYAGFALLLTGVFWQAELVPKLRAGWRDIQRARAAAAPRGVRRSDSVV